MKIGSTFFMILLNIILTKTISGQGRQDSLSGIIEPIVSYTCDAGRNFNGGIKSGNVYMGLIDAGIIIHTDKLWNGGEFLVELMNSHGSKLSANFIGDQQIVSNIERGNYTFLYQFLFVQRFSKGYLTIGIHDLNSEFLVNDFGSTLTNSSFAIPSSFPLNFPVSIYPNCAPAIVGSYKISDYFILRSGIYDGKAVSVDIYPYNINLSGFGFMSISELEFNSNNSLNTTTKFGGYYLSGNFNNPSDTLVETKGNYGFYMIAEQKLIDNDIRGLGVFGQVTYAPEIKNFNSLYAGFGLNLSAPLNKRSNDVVAFGIAYSRLYNAAYEYDFEFNYSFYLNKYISIQPVFHYIIHPGADRGLDNAFAGFLRINAGL
jgi:porin